MHTLCVTITYRDDTVEEFCSTDFPMIGNDWVTLYDNLKRIILPASGIKRLEYDVTRDKRKTK